MRMNNRYDEIINLPHHVSKTRPQMPMSDRAAQFAPFAALTGYDSAIKETGRLTDEKIELDEEALTALYERTERLWQTERDQIRYSSSSPTMRKESSRQRWRNSEQGTWEHISGRWRLTVISSLSLIHI